MKSAKIISLLALNLVVLNVLNSQIENSELKIIEGIECENEFGSLIGSDKSGFYFYKRTNSQMLSGAPDEIEITKLDRNLKFIISETIESQSIKNLSSTFQVHLINEDLIYFYVESDDDLGTITIQKKEINKDNLTFSGKGSVISTMDFSHFKKFKKRRGFIDVYQEEDFIMVKFELFGFGVKGERAAYVCMDKQLKVIWENMVELITGDMVTRLFINESQTIFYVKEKKVKEKGKVITQFKVQSLSDEANRINESIIDFNHKEVSQINVFKINENELAVMGYYNEKKEEVSGIFVKVYDTETLELKVDEYNELSASTINSSFMDQFQGLRNLAFSTFRIQNINGENYVLAESNYQGLKGGSPIFKHPEDLSLMGQNVQGGELQMVLGSVLIVKLNAKGNIVWEKLIEKNQYISIDDVNLSSYRLIKRDDKIQIIFNNNLDVSTRKKGKEQEVSLISVEIDSTGKTKRTMIKSFETGDQMPVVLRAIVLDKNNLILPSRMPKDKLRYDLWTF